MMNMMNARLPKDRRVKDLILSQGYPTVPKVKGPFNQNNSLKMPYRFNEQK